jgi:hypothetical protein
MEKNLVNIIEATVLIQISWKMAIKIVTDCVER